MLYQYKYQSVNITKASGTGAGTYKDFEIQLDSNYEHIVGFAAFENSGSAENYKLGLNDSVETYQDLINKKLMLSDSTVNQESKFHPVLIEIVDKRKMIAGLQILDTTSADINVDIVFKLRKEVVIR